MSDYEKQCQSCGMPLNNGENSGTEANGEKSHEYCNYCYQNGAFTEPNATLEEFEKLNQERMKASGVNPVLRWLSKFQLPNLKRWKGQK